MRSSRRMPHSRSQRSSWRSSRRGDGDRSPRRWHRNSEPGDVEIVGEVMGTPTIDLTCEADVVDLTTPVAPNHADPIVIGSSQSDASPPPRRARGRALRNADAGDSAAQDDSDIEDLTDSDLPPCPFNLNNTPRVAGAEAGPSAGDASFLSPAAPLTCPICFESYKKIKRMNQRIMSTTCGHVFCEECIQAAISTQHKCPTCRKRLTVRQVHPLFI